MADDTPVEGPALPESSDLATLTEPATAEEAAERGWYGFVRLADGSEVIIDRGLPEPGEVPEPIARSISDEPMPSLATAGSRWPTSSPTSTPQRVRRTWRWGRLGSGGGTTVHAASTEDAFLASATIIGMSTNLLD